MSGAARRRGRALGQITPFDGPASRGTGSAAGSQGPASAGFNQSIVTSDSASRRSSNVGQSQLSAQPALTLMRGDPAREGPAPRATDTIKNVDMPAGFYNIDQLYGVPTEFKKRPGYNNTGKVIQLPVNSFVVNRIPSSTIYQYDVIIGSGAEKRIVQEKVWNSKKRQQATSADMIYDGNKLAWSMTAQKQIRIMIDLDEEDGRGPSRDNKNAFRLHINPTKKVNLASIHAYLQGKVSYDNDILEAINFLDHLLREGPRTRPDLVAVRRSFFARDGQRADLGGGIEVFRGVYQSMRLAEGPKLVINLDVANTCFWKPQSLLNTIIQKNKYRDVPEIQNRLQNNAEKAATNKYVKRLTVKANYQGNPQPGRQWKVQEISGVTANTHRIEWRPDGKSTGEMISVTAYFKRKYNLTLQYPNLPMIQMTKKTRGQSTYFPMELLFLVENQRYGAKLDEIQTANMIKFAVSPPNVRLAAINEGKNRLRWNQDRYLQKYGLTISDQPISTQARVLPPPGVIFGGNKVEQPGTKGRWDLRGKKFFSTNPAELTSWGIGLFPGRTSLSKAQTEKFAMDFAKAYRGHGGSVAANPPYITPLNQDAGKAVQDLFQGTGNHFNKRPQLLIFLVQDKNSYHYLRIKKSCECRYGIVSQVMQAAQVAKGNPQYYSNVLMKVNAKLGGCTSKVQSAQNSGWNGKFGAPTMFIGSDVSHASPGSDQSSMAAITVSFDRHAGRYAAACQTNGVRVEMITEQNMRNLLGPLTQEWATSVGGGQLPQQVYYVRDGVSEGQFIKVIQEEVPAIRSVMNKLANGQWKGKMTVIVASKRHHTRAFPRQGDGDQKGNPLPGTVVERDVTSPFDFDWFCYSHTALQGTSRPVHYTVLIDEANHSPQHLQNMLYEHCYQYMRSTTSVSLHPAVYYAHLASNRAKAHEDVSAVSGPTGGAGYKQNQPTNTNTTESSEVKTLLPMAAGSKVQFSMWYI